VRKTKKECDLFLECLRRYPVACIHEGKSPWIWFAFLQNRNQAYSLSVFSQVSCLYHCLSS
jgi:hypothetical protein